MKKLIDACNPILEFYGAEMEKLADAGDAEERERRHRVLCELEIPDIDELPRAKIPLTLPVRLSAADIKRLEAFVTFEEEENAKS